MKLKPLFAIAGLTAALGFSLVITSADAQGRRGGRNGNPNGNQNGPDATNQTGVNPVQVQMMMSLNNNIVDPAVSAKFTLVYRVDVQNALGLDLKQKNALDALKTVQTQDQQKVTQDLRSLVQSTRASGQATTTTTDPPPTAQEVTAKLQVVSQGFQADLDKRVDEILTPSQRKRLNEIDLRWRGPLSLVDPKVADQAAVLGTDDKKKVQDAYKEFTDARQKLVDAMMPAGRTRGNAPTTAAATADGTTTTSADSGAASTQPNVPMSPAERQAAQRQARIDFDKSCAAMVTKLVANVTPATSAAWKEMLGAPFTFRDLNN